MKKFNKSVVFLAVSLLINILLMVLLGIENIRIETRIERINSLESILNEYDRVSNYLLKDSIFKEEFILNGYNLQTRDDNLLILPTDILIDDYYGFFVRVVADGNSPKIIGFGRHKP